ncbi:MAG: amino acid permease [Nitrospirae bacterium]|nr:amino acid permease [Nitrospirota bacterium]
MTPPISEPESKFSQQKIGWFTASCVLVSNIIGGGIFTTTGFMARDLGDPVLILLLWFVGALFALGGAMVYGELGAALPHAGGDYLYLREAYGPLVAFLSGWTSFTIGFGAALAASAVSFASYALRVIPLTDESGWRVKGLALSLLWAVTLVHCGGIGTGGFMQRLLTTTKVLAICGFILGGLLYGSGQWAHLAVPAPTSQPSLGTAAISFLFVMYSYLGWNVASYLAGDIADPQRSLPKIMVGGTAFVAGLYLLLNVVYLYALPITSLAQEPILPVAEKAAAALWGPGSAQFVAALLCLAIVGAVSAMVWAGPRIYWAMAHDGVISPWLAKLHAKSGVPVRVILLQSAWASLLILSGTFEQLIVYSGLVLALFMALTLSTLFHFHREPATGPHHYQAPLYPFLPATLIAGTLAIVLYGLFQRPAESLFGAATVLSGIPFYILWRRSQASTD